MPGETVKKISTIADSWWKILSIIGALVFGIYQLSSVWNSFHALKKDFEDYQVNQKYWNEVRDKRSDTRYDRAMEVAKELKAQIDKEEAELEKHLIEDAYFRGKTDAKFEIILKK